MAHPLKVASPATATRLSPPVQVSTPPPGFAPIDKVTVLVADAPVVIVFPAASVIATTGWVPNAWAAVDVAGCDLKTSLVATPPLTASAALSAEVNPAADATRTYGLAGEVGLALSTVHPAKAATPAATV